VLGYTHISMLTATGVDLRTIMERVGLHTTKTTLETCAHGTNKVTMKFG
jgi:hypothetical protein